VPPHVDSADALAGEPEPVDTAHRFAVWDAQRLRPGEPELPVREAEQVANGRDEPAGRPACTRIDPGRAGPRTGQIRLPEVGAVHVRAQRSATCASHSISLGGALVRNDVGALLDGEGVECTLNGLYLADRQRLVDHHTTIDHARPHCGSREVYKGILADHARGVFNGKIIVRPDAQKTDAKQTNRALLLSEDALINTKPQLEIFANDVKCTHGAAVGQLDDEALFYLRSRGLSAATARRMLIHAFAADVLNRLPLEAVRAGVEERLQRQLAHALPAAA